MGKRRMFDDDVEECFDKPIAIYFEALRYRQQLSPDDFFMYRTEDMQKRTGLSYKQQLRAHKWLLDTDWIEVVRKRDRNGGSILFFRITAFAKSLIKDTVRRRNATEFRQFFVKNLVQNYNIHRRGQLT